MSNRRDEYVGTPAAPLADSLATPLAARGATGGGGLALAVLILPLLAVACLALLVAGLSDAPTVLPATAMAVLHGVSGPGPATAGALRHAIEQAAAAAASTVLLSLPFGFAFARLPWRWAVVGRAMLGLPGLALLLATAAAGLLLLGLTGPISAVLGALMLVALPLDLRLAIVLVALPGAATTVARRMARLDRAALRAAASLGMGPVARFVRLVLPELLGALLNAAALTFAGGLLAALVLAAAGPLHRAGGEAAIAALPVAVRPLESLALAAAAVLLALSTVLRISRRR